jgi:hypothetical protein
VPRSRQVRGVAGARRAVPLGLGPWAWSIRAHAAVGARASRLSGPPR